MTIQNYKKAFSIVTILVAVYFTLSTSEQFRNIANSSLSDELISSEIIDDEIAPLCNGESFINFEELTHEDLKGIKIDLVEKDKWMENFYGLLTDDQSMYIKPEFKKVLKHK